MYTPLSIWSLLLGKGSVTEVILLISYFGGGISMLSGAPSSIMTLLGPVFHIIWASMLIIAPMVAITGTLMSNQWVGMWLRVSAQLSVTGALSAYLSTILIIFGPWTFAAWTSGGLTLVSIVSALRDIYRIRQTSRLVREDGPWT